MKLIERLTGILHVTDAVPGDAHKAFCTIPFDIVCTTNFDFLLERQYELTPRYVYPVIEEEQLSINGPRAGTLLEGKASVVMQTTLRENTRRT